MAQVKVALITAGIEAFVGESGIVAARLANKALEGGWLNHTTTGVFA